MLTDWYECKHVAYVKFFVEQYWIEESNINIDLWRTVLLQITY